MGEYFFWYRPTRVVPDKRPLNGCVCVCACVCVCHYLANVLGDSLEMSLSLTDQRWKNPVQKHSILRRTQLMVLGCCCDAMSEIDW